ncbi:hypothetical protein WH47_06718 [Habropoda laboriosa]|uniref:Uncharacterized protein n=1 Tax=Habropoda laboriosa TaxID=597456 RepID=A0A0L7QRI2_9HYME|nr:hypothetical protein WH47_06718 [Habropoda laboriosa]
MSKNEDENEEEEEEEEKERKTNRRDLEEREYSVLVDGSEKEGISRLDVADWSSRWITFPGVGTQRPEYVSVERFNVRRTYRQSGKDTWKAVVFRGSRFLRQFGDVRCVKTTRQKSAVSTEKVSRYRFGKYESRGWSQRSM